MPRRRPKLSKAEKKLRAENSEKQKYRDQLQREKKFTNVSYERGENAWEKLCEAIKLPEAQTELKCAMKNVVAVLDEKGNVLNRLAAFQRNGEEQHRRNFGKHFEFIEYILNVFNLFVNILKDNYENMAIRMIKRLRSEVDNYDKYLLEQKTYFENVLFASNLIASNRMSIKGFEFQERLIDEINANEYVRRDILGASISQKMTEIHMQMRAIAENITKKVTLDWGKQYNRIFEIDGKSMDEITNLCDQIRRRNALIITSQQDYSAFELKSTRNIIELKRELEEHKQKFRILRRTFENDMQLDRDNLRILVGLANGALKVIVIYVPWLKCRTLLYKSSGIIWRGSADTITERVQ